MGKCSRLCALILMLLVAPACAHAATMGVVFVPGSFSNVDPLQVG